MSNLHPWVEVSLRWKYGFEDVVHTWHNCPHDNNACRALFVHATHSRSGHERTAARLAIATLIGDEEK